MIFLLGWSSCIDDSPGSVLCLNLSKHNDGKLVLGRPWAFYLWGAVFSPLMTVVPARSTAELQSCSQACEAALRGASGEGGASSVFVICMWFPWQFTGDRVVTKWEPRELGLWSVCRAGMWDGGSGSGCWRMQEPRWREFELPSTPSGLAPPCVMRHLWHWGGALPPQPPKGAHPACFCPLGLSRQVSIQDRISVTPSLLCWFHRTREEWEVPEIYFGH